MDNGGTRRKFRPLTLLLFVPFAALIWVPFYNRAAPDFIGIPFFYWYQLLWIVLGAILIAVVYFLEERGGRAP